MSQIDEENLVYYEVQKLIYAVNEYNYLNRFLSLNVMLDNTIVTTIREVKNYWQALS